MPDMSVNADITPPSDPWSLFREWYLLAERHEPDDPNAMALATVGTNGAPSLRMVLMKGFEGGALTFFTNRQSRKGKELAENQQAAICLYWKSLNRQIRLEGLVTELGDPESDAYFATRARGSQLGAWVSQQSCPVASRAQLAKEANDIETTFRDKPVPRPPYWGGYRITPQRIEFWQEREFRLHDRIVYYRPDSLKPWTIERLYP